MGISKGVAAVLLLARAAAGQAIALPPAPGLRLPATLIDPFDQPPVQPGMVSWVAVAREIYILQRDLEKNPVQVFDRNGRLRRSWGKGLFDLPHAIRLDARGRVWTVDCGSHTIRRFSDQGKLELTIKIPEAERVETGGFSGPTDIAFAPDGRLLVSDGYRNNRILVYSAEGKRLREWGRKGTGPGEFDLPHSLATDGQVLYVADRSNNRIQRFDLEGKFLGQWTNLGKTFGITVTPRGELWIATQLPALPNDAAGWLIRLDLSSGAIRGWVESPFKHSVDASADGTLFPGGPKGRVVVFLAGPR